MSAALAPRAAPVAARAQRDPVWFSETILGSRLWSGQRRIVESVRDHKRTAVRSGHGVGKTRVAADIVLWFLFSHYMARVITTAPTFRQVSLLLWAEVASLYHGAKFPLGGRYLKEPKIEITDKWFAVGFSTDEEQAFQGHHAPHLLVVLDEAAGIPERIWTETEGLLTGEHARLLTIGNAIDPTSLFAQEFKSTGVNKIAVSAFDSPNFTEFGVTLEDIRKGNWAAKVKGPMPIPALVTPEWVAERHRKWGEGSPLWKARVLGEFPEEATNSLIKLAWLEAAQQRTLQPSEPRIVACDPARYGDDETVIGKRQGPVYRKAAGFHGQGTMQTVGHCALAAREIGATEIRIDVTGGLGAGPADRLREGHGHKYRVVDMNASRHEGVNREEHENERAAMYWALRTRFESGEIDIDADDDELASQLLAIHYELTSAGRLKIEEKDNIKELIGRSPDDADTCAMAFAKSPDAEAELW